MSKFNNFWLIRRIVPARREPGKSWKSWNLRGNLRADPQKMMTSMNTGNVPAVIVLYLKWIYWIKRRLLLTRSGPARTIPVAQ